MIYSRVVIDIATGKIEYRSRAKYYGPVIYLKGSTAAQNNISSEQQVFYNTMTQNYSTMFAGQTAILKSLTDAFTPILQAGPNQFGYGPQAQAAMRTAASDTNAAVYQNAQAAARSAEAARGGGNIYLPSGTDAQISAGITQAGAAQEAQAQNQITLSGYEAGRQNWLAAANVLGGAASTYNPAGFAGQTTGAGEAAASEANAIQKANAAASPWATVGGILGGVAGSFLGPVGTALGSKVGSWLGGGGSSGGGGGGGDTSWVSDEWAGNAGG